MGNKEDIMTLEYEKALKEAEITTERVSFVQIIKRLEEKYPLFLISYDSKNREFILTPTHESS